MKRIINIICSLFIVLTLTNCTSTMSKKSVTIPISSVSDVMENPVYEKTISVYGVISELGIRNSKSFKLSSGGKSINVWYGMMVYDNRKRQPAVDMTGFKNDTVVILTGMLKNKGKYVQKNDFWIISIKKK